MCHYHILVASLTLMALFLQFSSMCQYHILVASLTLMALFLQFSSMCHYHKLVASLTMMALFYKTEPSEFDWLQVYDNDTLVKNCF